MKGSIYTMEIYENRQKNSVGSSRIRGTWLTRYWPEVELFKIGKKYDFCIFQKAYHLDYMRVFPGIKILDLCDPDWLDGKPIMESIEICDAVTTSTEPLAEYLRTMTDKPVLCIPDRLDLAEHTQTKVHEGPAKKAVWFGYHNNQVLLDPALPTLKRLGLTLTVISDLPYYPSVKAQNIDDNWVKENVTNIKYDPETANDDIINSGDVVLNPRLEDGRFKYKSNNKTLTAWALGMPVAQDSEELERFLDPEERKREAVIRRKEVEEKWDVRFSVESYKKLLSELYANSKQIPT